MKTLGTFIMCLLIGGSAWGAGSPAVACRDVPEAESHLAVLLSAADVLQVEDLGSREHLADATIPSGDGARIILAARPFTTASWLKEAIDCHRARKASARASQPSPTFPVDVKGANFRVTSGLGTLIVDVTARDGAAAREIRGRAHALAPTH